MGAADEGNGMGRFGSHWGEGAATPLADKTIAPAGLSALGQVRTEKGPI